MLVRKYVGMYVCVNICVHTQSHIYIYIYRHTCKNNAYDIQNVKSKLQLANITADLQHLDLCMTMCVYICVHMCIYIYIFIICILCIHVHMCV